MIRTLLNTFPTWLLAIATVGVAVALSVAGLLFVRRRFPDLGEHGGDDVAGVAVGVLAAILGVLLGFVTVSMYQDFTGAKDTVRTEATELIQLYNDSRAFTPTAAAAVKREITSYIATVRFDEWERMREGDADARLGDKHVAGLYRALRDYEPDTASRSAFYTDAVARLSNVVDARRSRLGEASNEMPGAFLFMLVLGAALLVGSLYLVATSNRRLHLIMVASVAVITSFNLLVVVALDHPFSGDISVSNEPFDQERLKLLKVTRADVANP